MPIRAGRAAAAAAARLTEPAAVPLGAPPQSLAAGALGIALVHIERARGGDEAAWRSAHAWLQAAARDGVDATDRARLFHGAPALAAVLVCADDESGRYATARSTMTHHVRAVAHRRLDAAFARMDRGALPVFGEYDLLSGLTGIGAVLLRTDPASSALERVLSYLVRLTEPVRVDGCPLPGWWVGHAPHQGDRTGFAGGHANLGMAHGITGPLALLSLALQQGAIVTGQVGAIVRICAWLDSWQQDAPAGAWWPRWITRDEHRARRCTQPGPLRPSWCYGTPAIARAQQLAALATGDLVRQRRAEQVLADCLNDPAQLGQIIGPGLCHGWAGVFQTVWRTARDSHTPVLADCLPRLAEHLITCGASRRGGEAGFLDGDAGLALALRTAARREPPASDWDACLLIR